MFNKIFFFVFLIMVSAGMCLRLAGYFGYQNFMSFELYENYYLEIPPLVSSLLTFWGLYRGAFKKYLKPWVVYCLLIHIITIGLLDYYSNVFKYFLLDAVKPKELLVSGVYYFVVVVLLCKVTFAAKEKKQLQVDRDGKKAKAL